MNKNAGMQNVHTLHTGCNRNLRQETQENQFSFTGFRCTSFRKRRDREREGGVKTALPPLQLYWTYFRTSLVAIQATFFYRCCTSFWRGRAVTTRRAQLIDNTLPHVVFKIVKQRVVLTDTENELVRLLMLSLWTTWRLFHTSVIGWCVCSPCESSEKINSTSSRDEREAFCSVILALCLEIVHPVISSLN